METNAYTYLKSKALTLDKEFLNNKWMALLIKFCQKISDIKELIKTVTGLITINALICDADCTMPNKHDY